jgi:hypothetical protein
MEKGLIDADLGGNLFKKRIAKVTQPEFAKILSVSPSTIAKWETNFAD